MNVQSVEQRSVLMLLEVHHGDDAVLLVNGNCRGIHLLDYLRSCCHLPVSLTIDLCLLNSGEPIHLSSMNSRFLPFDRNDCSSHLHCVLTWIDDQGTYIPLSTNPKLINNEFLAKLKKATNGRDSAKISPKITKQTTTNSSKKQTVKRRRSLKSIALAAAFTKMSHS